MKLFLRLLKLRDILFLWLAAVCSIPDQGLNLCPQRGKRKAPASGLPGKCRNYCFTREAMSDRKLRLVNHVSPRGPPWAVTPLLVVCLVGFYVCFFQHKLWWHLEIIPVYFSWHLLLCLLPKRSFLLTLSVDFGAASRSCKGRTGTDRLPAVLASPVLEFWILSFFSSLCGPFFFNSWLTSFGFMKGRKGDEREKNDSSLALVQSLINLLLFT